jgi:gamma-glutamylcyclotransferase (GGCT)/AIG2-like uncharacterized protein YtfP
MTSPSSSPLTILPSPSTTEPWLSISSEHRLRAENLPFDIDVWYPRLEAFTFRSVFEPLTRSEARAIVNYYRTRHRLARDTDLSAADVEQLDQLEDRLDHSIRRSFGQSGAFLRLCGRSPKDAEPLDRAQVRASYSDKLRELLQAGASDTSITKLTAIARVSWLRVTSGAEAMSLLLTSERVYADMIDWLQWGEPEQVVLREWEAELSLEYEFRCFVHCNALTAISQYDHYGVYPHLEALRPRIQQLIVDKWQQVHEHVGEPSYVIDFGYLLASDRVVVIEISPFLPCTGSALFRWSTDHDQLHNGPLEFRLNQHVHQNIDELIESNWDDRWHDNVPSYREFYKTATGVTQIPTDPDPVESRSLFDTVLSAATSLFSKKRSSSSDSDVGSDVEVGATDSTVPTATATTTTVSASPTATSSSSVSVSASASASASAAAKSTSSNSSVPLLVPSSHGSRVFCTKAEADKLDPNVRYLLFVYGTLKSGFHWNHKFLSQATCVMPHAVTDAPYPLVVGDSGVPYLLGESELLGRGQPIVGEVWCVNQETMLGLDEYEGVSKGYYDRRTIVIQSAAATAEEQRCELNAIEQIAGLYNAIANNELNQVNAFVYFKATPTPSLWMGPFLREYTLEYHRAHYAPIRHIQVKQQKYLGVSENQT